MDIWVCRQVDNFAAACKHRHGAKRFMEVLQGYVKAEYNGMGIEMPDCHYERYNGLDIHQAQDFIKIGCELYIDRMLQTHGWTEPKKGTRDPHNLVPIRPEVTERLMKLEGPTEKSPEAKAIAEQMGYGYREVLGKLIFAFVLCCLDIGFAMCFLSRFATNPMRSIIGL